MTKRRQGSTDTRTSRFGVYLDEATHKALLKVAIDENTSATALVERLIRAYLAKPRGRRAKG
jgi:hypothetical protein